jgi:hypothetical protein
VQVDVRVGDGPRASVQELMLLETPRADQVAPIVTLDLAPGQRVAPDAPITGTVTDDVGVRRVEIGVVEGSEVTWHPARELRTTGVFTWSHDGGTELVTLRARAFDHAGNLAESADVAVQFDDRAPGAPLLVTATDAGDDTGGAIRVTWTPSRDDGDGAFDVTTYEILRRRATGLYFETLATVAAGTTAFVDTTAVDGVPYRYRVIAVDAGGLASLPVLSNEATSRDESVANDLVPPPDVTGLSASADADSAYLTWTKSTDDDGDLVDQWVDVSVDGGLSWGSNAPDFDDGTAAAVGPGRSWYRWRGLADGVDHRLRVRVVDSNGNVSPGTQSGVVTPSPTGAMTLSGTLPTDVSLADGVWRVTDVRLRRRGRRRHRRRR